MLIALSAAGHRAADLVARGAWPPWAQARVSAAPPRSSISAPSSASPTPPWPSPAGTLNVAPGAVTLQSADLPAGYHVLRQGLASFSPADQTGAVPSWDVVFAPDSGRPADYLLVESLVAVFPDSATAAAALATTMQAEQAQHAVEWDPVPGLGDQQTVWVEAAPDRPSYGIVRVTWQYQNVLGQVSVLGPIVPLQPAQTIQLARVEQNRISMLATPV